jgi:hypothetical protein
VPVRPVHHRRDAETMRAWVSAHAAYLAHIGGADKAP